MTVVTWCGLWHVLVIVVTFCVCVLLPSFEKCVHKPWRISQNLHWVGCVCRGEPLHRSFRRHVACRRRPPTSKTIQLYGQWRCAPSRHLGSVQWQEGWQQPELGTAHGHRDLGEVSDCECAVFHRLHRAWVDWTDCLSVTVPPSSYCELLLSCQHVY